jgi:transposase
VTRGWHRPTTGTATEREQLLEQARDLGWRVETARLEMLELAAQRQNLLLTLYSRGMSIRELAAALKVSPAVVAAAIRTARAATAGEDGAELTCPPASTPDKTGE